MNRVEEAFEREIEAETSVTLGEFVADEFDFADRETFKAFQAVERARTAYEIAYHLHKEAVDALKGIGR